MTAILNSTPPPPPRHWLTKNLTTAWLRLGKAAVFSVLAGLAVAAGLAFPGGEAAAQGYGGYTYTARVCQEYGQQPRYYNVRDGQAAYNGGNSDSGWLIVLERGANVFPAQYAFGAPYGGGTWNSAQAAYNASLTHPAHRLFTGAAANAHLGLANGEAIIDSNGIRGFVTRVSLLVVIDRNDNGVYDAGDMAAGLGSRNASQWTYVLRNFSRTAAAYDYGGSYVRWAHMAWCR